MTLILSHKTLDRVNLAELQVGPIARVKSVQAENAVMLRLMEMGLVPGTPVQVLKRAPFGGPMELRVRDYRLSIRRREAQRLVVDFPDTR